MVYAAQSGRLSPPMAWRHVSYSKKAAENVLVLGGLIFTQFANWQRESRGFRYNRSSRTLLPGKDYKLLC
jgi:hypothetical protein